MSFQGHPEFPLDYVEMLIDRRQKRALLKTPKRIGLESLRQPDDCAQVIGWIRQFLKGDDEGLSNRRSMR